ncbi:MAG: ABC transporter ATP-binding protein [Clostridiales bacterium]|jgi:ABC-2 type transport system ATP-binding protein|nr:ABC transporter ATP-binding protein [Clostridiales bacterium]
MDVLNAINLSKSFGTEKVIDGLTFSVPEGSIFGFIGKNGAGKTTTMKMALGLIPADGGEIAVCGERVAFGRTDANRHIGYLPDVPEFYGYMRPKEYLKLCGEITGMDSTRIKARSDELLCLVGLSDANKKIGGFSRGMKQRLGIVQALLNEPKLLICDEPTSALDPVGRKEILGILRQVKDRTTVIFSTHILSDVERICDRIAVLDKGKIALSGTLAELRAQYRADEFVVEFATMEENNQFSALIKPTEQTETSATFRTRDMRGTQARVLAILSQNDLLPLRLEVIEPTIENLFMEVIL